MRKLLGGLVLIAGVGGLGYWGANAHAVRMQTAITDAAGAAVQSSVHGVQTSVAGRDITAQGLADTQAEKDALLAGLNAIDGRRVVIDEIEVLPVAEPYSFAATVKDGRVFGQGNVPTETMRAALAASEIEGVDGLTLASGAPERWETALGAGLSVVTQMDTGALSMEGQNLRLSGIVDTPADRDQLLSALTLPEGYTLTSDIETRDDGKPVAFDLSYDASTGASASGKLPAGLDLAQMAEALGLETVSGDAKAGMPGTPDAALDMLGKLKEWLPEMEQAKLSFEGETATLNGQVTPGADPDLLARVMGEDFGEGLSVTLARLANDPANGTTRTNAATGQAERFTNGYWLPDVPFSPSLNSCGRQTDALLARARINFLSGSAQLGPRAIRAINALAAVLRRCVNEAGLTAEIGGHTDNTGTGNFPLSADRAVVVREAMIARGVPGEALSAVGFGASKPIADNATEEGRAANRRTTVRWSR